MIDWKTAALYGIGGALAGGLLSVLLPKSAAAAPATPGPGPVPGQPPTPKPGTRPVGGGPTVPAVFPTGSIMDALTHPDSNPGARSGLILEAVRRGKYDKPDFRMLLVGALDAAGKVRAGQDDDFGMIPVTVDAMKIEGVRYNVTYPVHALIARDLGLQMLTQFVADLMWRQAAVRLQPLPNGGTLQSWAKDGTMGLSSRMIQYSQAIDSKLAGQALGDEAGPYIIGNLGKDWLLTAMGFSPAMTPPSPPDAVVKCQPHPYNVSAIIGGWYGEGPSHSITGLPEIQGLSYCHDRGHSDYSQLSRYMSQFVWVHRAGDPVDQGTWMPVADVLTGPLARLLTGPEGVLPGAFPPNISEPAVGYLA